MRKILAFILVLSLMGAVLYFSSQSGGESNSLSRHVAKRIIVVMEQQGDTTQTLEKVNLIVRKLAHFSEYLLLAVLLAVVLTYLVKRVWVAVPLAALVGVGFAFCDEWVQSGSPGRTQSIFDVMVDGAGIAVGLTAFCIVSISCYAAGGRRKHGQ